MKKRLPQTLLVLTICLSVLFALPLLTDASAAGFNRGRIYNGQFTDVSSGVWYYQGVKDSYELGLMNGTSTDGTTFSPSGMFTVAEAMTISARMHHIYNGGDGTLPITSSDWRQNAANYCLSNGLCNSGQFDNYYRNITRAEMIMLFAAAQSDSEWTAINSIKELPDVSASTDYYSAIFKLYNAGVLVGNDDYGTCNPYAYITRAEVAAIAARCADPNQRLKKSLTPLSQRQAPEISSPNYEMSSGLMRFQDADTNMYGYINGAGEVKVAAMYSDASDFSEYGYAIVKQDERWGLLRADGTLVVPISYSSIEDFGNGDYKAKIGDEMYCLIVNGSIRTDCIYETLISLGNGGYKAKMTNGQYCLIVDGSVKSDYIYEDICSTGLDFIARTNTGSWDMYNISGVKMSALFSEPIWKVNCPLFAVKSGNKWALATETGPITEYLYDSIELYDNCTLAILVYGTQKALAGENGVVTNLGEYSFLNPSLGEYISGDYALVYNGEQYALADATGVVSDFFSSQYTPRLAIGTTTYVHNGVAMATADTWIPWAVVFDAKHSETYIPVSGTQNAGYALLSDGTYFLMDGIHCENFSSVGNGYYVFSVDGKYGIGQDVSNWYTPFTWELLMEPSCDSPEEAIATYGYYMIGTENGKPVVLFGNPVAGFTSVIKYFKNNMYFDEIKDVGEGYYACRFNETWYLLHA